MAQSRRVERVASLIRREISELLIGGIKDERVNQGMVSVTTVEVAGPAALQDFCERLRQRRRQRASHGRAGFG